MILALDTETTGIDLHHGAKPFFVTTCDEKGRQVFWEWDVNPLTREPEIPPGDVENVLALLRQADELVLQNAKFDALALLTIGIDFDEFWPKVQDTLILGHLLASNQPHDLTSMLLQYVGVDIQPVEDALEIAVKDARKLAKARFPEFAIAKQGAPGMPSVKGGSRSEEKPWKNDTWLPRVLHKLGEGEAAWATATKDYANADSAGTLKLWYFMKAELDKAKLWNIYKERLKVLPSIFAMERYGVSVNGENLKELRADYLTKSEKEGAACVNLASSRGFSLTLPKSGNNKSLLMFCFDHSGLNLPPVERTERGEPSLNAAAIDKYRVLFPTDSDEAKFITSLRNKRRADTAVSYMDGYERFWLPNRRPGWFTLYPSINPTGTNTLRFSSHNPNEQNISKKEGFNLRQCFGPAPGREWWSFDAKNIELRLPAYESGEEAFIDLFEHPDEAPYFGSNHLLVSHILFPDEFESCRSGGAIDGRIFKKEFASTLYDRVKRGNFAVQYGAVDRADGLGTADRAYGVPGAQSRIKARFVKQEALNQKYVSFAEKHGYVETMPDRSVDQDRGYPILCTRTPRGRVLQTVPFNYHVQGSACWWTMKGMIRCHALLVKWTIDDPRGYYLVLQVHDELVLDFPLGYGNKPWVTNLGRARKLKVALEQGGDDLGVPTPVSMEYHTKTYAEGVPV